MFKRKYDTGLGLDYSFHRNLQAYGRFAHEALDGRARSIGTLEGPALTSPVPFTAKFGDADNMSLQISARYSWNIASGWRAFYDLD